MSASNAPLSANKGKGKGAGTPPISSNQLKCFQAVAAMVCLEKVSEGSTMSKAQQEQAMFDLYHGRGNSDVGQTELMLAGSGGYAGLYDSKVPGSPDLMVKERL